MWECPDCKREFFIKNQRHYCCEDTIDDVFAGKAENVVLAFDALLLAVGEWEPQTIGAGKKAVIFNNGRAWLVVRPMKSVLDICFFYDRALTSPVLHNVRKYSTGKNFFHHIRIGSEEELTPEILDLLKMGFAFMLTK